MFSIIPEARAIAPSMPILFYLRCKTNTFLLRLDSSNLGMVKICSAVKPISFRLNCFTFVIDLSRYYISFSVMLHRSICRTTFEDVSEFIKLLIAYVVVFFKGIDRSVSLSDLSCLLSCIVSSYKTDTSFYDCIELPSILKCLINPLISFCSNAIKA